MIVLTTYFKLFLLLLVSNFSLHYYQNVFFKIIFAVSELSQPAPKCTNINNFNVNSLSTETENQKAIASQQHYSYSQFVYNLTKARPNSESYRMSWLQVKLVKALSHSVKY